MLIITILAMISGNGFNERLGIPVIDGISITIIVSFQLFGGFYTMEYIKEDLFSAKKWRIYSLPYPVHLHAFSILITCTLFSALQGLVMVIYTQLVYGVNWGSIGLVLFVLVSLSLLTQLVFLMLAMGVKNFKHAERLGEVYGLGSMALAGVWFRLPDNALFNFLTTYGNPVSLGENAILSFVTQKNIDRGVLSLGILLAASAVMALLATILGRRKLV